MRSDPERSEAVRRSCGDQAVYMFPFSSRLPQPIPLIAPRGGLLPEQQSSEGKDIFSHLTLKVDPSLLEQASNMREAFQKGRGLAVSLRPFQTFIF